MTKAKFYGSEGIGVIPGKKICSSCRKSLDLDINKIEKEAFYTKQKGESSQDESSAAEFSDVDVNEDLSLIGISPLKTHSKARSTRISLGKRKISQIQDV